MRDHMPALIFIAGLAQWSILVASALVPRELEWRTTLSVLPKLYRQLFWIYGGYVVLGIIANGAVCVCFAAELANGSTFSRVVCGYIAIFWGVRLSLQAVLDAKPFLTTWWLRAGYHLLTVLFASVVLVLGWAAMG